MSYLFDSDVCIEIIRGKDRKLLDSIRDRYGEITVLDCLTSVVVEAELRVGVFKSRDPGGGEKKVDAFLSRFSVLAVDRSVARKYAEIRSDLERAGNRIGGNDLFIAATAMVHDLTLLTRNQREYARIPGLKLASI